MHPNGALLTGVTFKLDYAWNRIVYSEHEDSWIREYGSYGSSGNCQFFWPKSIAALAPFNDVSASNYHYIYVADTRNNRIVRLQYDWQNQNMICNSPITGKGLVQPADLDLNDGSTFYPNSDDYLWVINDTGEVKRFTIGGVLRNTFGNYGCTGQAGDFCHLTAIVSGRSSFLVYPNDPYANNSHLYVADGGNSRIVWLIKTTGGESVAWMSEAPTSQFIVDLETDIFGQLWAVDQYAGTITKYRYDLFPLCTFGSTGIGVNEFIQPISITNNGGYYGFGNMSVGESWTDSSGFQYFAIGTDVVDFAVTSSQSQSWHYIDFVLVDPSDVSVIVYDQQGGLVKTLFDGSQFSGPVSLVWDGTDGSNAPQPAGDYRVEVVDTCTYWNITTQAPVNVVTKEAWFHHEPPCCVGTRGDVNGDGADLDMVDLTCITDFLFGSGCVQPCPEEADPNGDTSVSDIVDMTFIVDWLFGNPPSLVSCP